MIYLLTQMILCLVLAGVAGGAIGWLLHRARTARGDESLRETIVRQHHQLRHAETDVAMLTDDFDDLKQRSQTEIETLRAENRRLPTLVQNLDKSQTLVRQLMQKHEAQLREAVQQNETLRARLTGHDEREAAFARARSELESARAELQSIRARDGGAAPDAAPERPVGNGVESPDDVPESPATMASGATGGALGAASGRSDPSANGAVPFGRTMPETARPAAATGPVAVAAERIGPAIDALEAVPDDACDDRTDATVVIRASDLPADATPLAASSERASPFPGFGSRDGDTGHFPYLQDAPAASGGPDDAPPPPDAGRPDRSTTGPAPSPVASSGLLDDDLSEDDFDDFDEDEEDFDAEDIVDEDLDGLDDPNAEDEDEDEDENLLDESVELLFEPVDRHDDLQRIFGIGPVTERALNRLGITSYTQIAKLQRHEVEQIADALQIYPGRIERDDWVGNARRQLEDVLEEL